MGASGESRDGRIAVFPGQRRLSFEAPTAMHAFAAQMAPTIGPGRWCRQLSLPGYGQAAVCVARSLQWTARRSLERTLTEPVRLDWLIRGHGPTARR